MFILGCFLFLVRISNPNEKELNFNYESNVMLKYHVIHMCTKKT